eukprot:6197283-Prymnesium_polylepis.1
MCGVPVSVSRPCYPKEAAERCRRMCRNMDLSGGNVRSLRACNGITVQHTLDLCVGPRSRRSRVSYACH